MTTAALLLAVAAVSAAGTALARAYALRRRLLDEPGERRSHRVATPRGGGLGPVLGIALALAMIGGMSWPYDVSALLMVAAIGAWDDHRPLPASWRLAVHVLAGVMLASGHVDPRTAPFAFGMVVASTAVLVNVWNFMDGIDGIAASQAGLVAGAAIALAGRDATASSIAVACAAFLPFNFPKARIFLGDVGSGALGVAMAIVAVHSIRRDPVDGLRLAIPASAFLVDAGMTLMRRMLRRERWWEPHAQHLYQAMARRWGHPAVTLGYAGWTLAATAIAALPARPAFTVASVLMWYTTAALLWLVLQRRLATGCDTH